MFQVYFEYIKNSVMRYISSILQVYFEPVFEMHLYFFPDLEVYILEVDFQDLCIYCQTKKYT